MKSPAIIFLSTLSFGCAKQASTYTAADADSAKTDDSALTDANDLWAQRGNKAMLTKALESYEQLYSASPSRELGAKLTRGWYFYGDAYESDIEAKKAAWDKAQAFGTSCMKLNADYAALLDKSGKREDAAAMLTIEDVPCTYWTASALGKWAKSSGLSTTLKHIGAAKAYIAKVQELNPDFFYGAPHRYWGAYYAGLPSFAGQDLDRSKKEFETAIEKAPDYLGTRVLVADYWAVKTQDVAVFDEMIQYVMASDANALDPALLAENTAEIAKANALWAARAEKFLDPGEPAALKEQPPVVAEPAAPAEEAAAPAEEAAAPAE